MKAAVAAVDEDLLALLREWRRELSKKSLNPAFMILTDATLLDLCARRPASREALLLVTGIGERKAEQYGEEILAVLGAYETGHRATPRLDLQNSPAAETIRLIGEGRGLEEIAELRDRRLATVVGMVADLVEKGELAFQAVWVAEGNLPVIEEAVGRLGYQWLKPLREALPESVSYEEIRLVVAKCRREAGVQ